MPQARLCSRAKEWQQLSQQVVRKEREGREAATPNMDGIRPRHKLPTAVGLGGQFSLKTLRGEINRGRLRIVDDAIV